MPSTLGLPWEIHSLNIQPRAAAAVAIDNARLYQETDRLRAFNENIVQSMEEGILPHRRSMEAEETGKMPLVGREEPDVGGLELIRQWTEGME